MKNNVLLVHESNVIRAVLAHHLSGQYKVVEALEGEFAWHTAMLNHDICMIISGLDLYRLDGMSLLDRLRHSSLERLKKLPFYFIGSESRINAIEEQARKAGVTGFMFNGVSKDEVLDIMARHAEGNTEPAAPDAIPTAATPTLAETPPRPAPSAPAKKSGLPPGGLIADRTATRGKGKMGKTPHSAALLSETLFVDGVRRMCSYPGTQNAVLVFTLDGYTAIAASLGAPVAGKIIERLAHLVQEKIGISDIVGHDRPGTFAIVTQNSNMEACAGFARRVIRGLSAANIVYHGKPVVISISVGIASRPEDGNLDGDALLALARSRSIEASKSGGGRIRIN
ncbi:MAG: diguanylate cyclase [Zoogloeaceae bacterium]|jgi:GGDEF domain-containing protein/DNA-binding NarL/FixJ family response regulator|nr:diguanylate cyclase [Zoogloeaceae bacterium]